MLLVDAITKNYTTFWEAVKSVLLPLASQKLQLALLVAHHESPPQVPQQPLQAPLQVAWEELSLQSVVVPVLALQ